MWSYVRYAPGARLITGETAEYAVRVPGPAVTPPTLAEVQAEAARLGFVACGVASLEPSRARRRARRAGSPRGVPAPCATSIARRGSGRSPRCAAPRGALRRGGARQLRRATRGARPARAMPSRWRRYARGTDYHLVTLGRLLALKEWLLGARRRFRQCVGRRRPGPRARTRRAGRPRLDRQEHHADQSPARVVDLHRLGLHRPGRCERTPRSVTDHCGSCTRCLDACPTEAFVAPRVLDATRCLSYLTHRVQARSAAGARWPHGADWAFGCDICNDVCPWNVKFAEPTTIAEFRRRAGAGPSRSRRVRGTRRGGIHPALRRHSPGASGPCPDAPQRPARDGGPAGFRVMSVALHSIAIFVHDIDKALHFYNRQLGLPVGKQGSFGFELLDNAPHVGVHPAQHPDAKAMVGRHTGLTFEVDRPAGAVVEAARGGRDLPGRAGAAGLRDDGDGQGSRRQRDGALGGQRLAGRRRRAAAMSLPREFASDNTAPAHPAVLEAMAAANHGPAHAYGADAWTAQAVAWFRDQFGGDTRSSRCGTAPVPMWCRCAR